MKSYTLNMEGFRIDVATGAAQGEEILLTDADLAVMGGVKPNVTALRKAFKGALAPPVLKDGSVFLALLSDRDTLPVQADQIIADTVETVVDLEANASKDHPAPIESVTKSAGIVSILETAADSLRKHGTRMVIQQATGDWEIPTLDPSVFVRPEKPETLEMGGTYIVRGFERDHVTKGHLMYVGASKLGIALPLNDPEWAYKRVWWAADTPTYLVAKLQRTSRNSYWMFASEASLVRQEDMLHLPDA